MMTLLEGLILGFGYVMPIGAQNLFVVQSSITKDLKGALVVSSIVILMDISLAMACFFGAGFIFSSHLYIASIVQVLGGLYLLKLAYDLFSSKTNINLDGDNKAVSKNVVKTAFVLTWLNPQALIDGSVLLGGINASLVGFDKAWFILGVCLASIFWFYGITIGLNSFKGLLGNKSLKIINITCGAILAIFGLKLVYGAIQIL